jgi:hypothetical protein
MNPQVGRAAADEIIARRRADTCDRIASKERVLARAARAKAQTARAPLQTARLDELARLHDDAALHQEEAAAYYRRLADRIASRVVFVGDESTPPRPDRVTK